MPVFQCGDISVQVDDDGFLLRFDQWSRELAVAMASAADMDELTDDHWKLIDYLRGYFKEFGVAPMIKKLIADTGFKMMDIYDLFPSGPAKGACRIAGVPKPEGCVRQTGQV